MVLDRAVQTLPFSRLELLHSKHRPWQRKVTTAWPHGASKTGPKKDYMAVSKLLLRDFGVDMRWV